MRQGRHTLHVHKVRYIVEHITSVSKAARVNFTFILYSEAYSRNNFRGHGHIEMLVIDAKYALQTFVKV